ncbi:MAG TPA: hypothetical protein VE961_17550 [Pyrinomonadaceae bacterium]|nr:hypothetical protein [Pyrinomonadaceae bacterium]
MKLGLLPDESMDRLELFDGSAANIDFAATNPVAANRDQCRNDGWKIITRSEFSAFKNQGDDIQYVNTGR